MAAKQLAFADDARMRLKEGIDVLAKAVATTLGPKGRNVALDRKFGSPTITHDPTAPRRPPIRIASPRPCTTENASKSVRSSPK